MTINIAVTILFSLLSIARNIPAPIRVRRARSSAGLSPTSVGIGLGSAIAWTAYAIWEQAWEGAISTIIVFAILAWWAIEMIRFGSSATKIFSAFIFSTASVVIVVLVSLTLEMGTFPLVILVILSGVAFGVPRLLVGMRSSSLVGISALYLLLNIVDAVTFGIYGLLNESWGFSAYAATQKEVLLEMSPTRTPAFSTTCKI